MPLHVHRLVGAMRGRGYTMTVVSLARIGPVGEMLRADGVEVHACRGLGGWDFRVLGRLRRIIAKVQPDLVHTFLFHANFAGRYAARRAGFPADRVVCEIQTAEIERRWHLWVDRHTHEGCRFTIGNSPSVVEHLAQHAGIPKARLRLVRGGIDPTPYAQAQPLDRAVLGLTPTDRVILWVGRLDPVKGLLGLFQAFQRLANISGLYLLLAGEGKQRAELEAAIRQANLEGRIRLLGARRDIPALLKTADVFAFPSLTEGLPNALLEAMAAACPIVTTEVPGCRDLISGEENGLVVPYGDIAALVIALRRLLDDRALAASLGARAAQEVSSTWHLERTFRSYAAIYEEIGPRA